MFKGVKMKDPVEGTAQIVSCTGYHEGVMANCRMQLVIQAEGVEATPSSTARCCTIAAGRIRG